MPLSHVSNTLNSNSTRFKQLGSLLIYLLLGFIAGLLTVYLNVKVFLVLAGSVILILMLRSYYFAFLVTVASLGTGYMFYIGDVFGTVPISIPKICGVITLFSLFIHILIHRSSK